MAVVHQVIFELCTYYRIFAIQLGDPFPLSHSIPLCLYSPDSFHPLWMLYPSLSQCFQVIFCCAFSSKIVCLESSFPHPISYTMSMSVLLFLIYHHYLSPISCHLWGTHHFPPLTSLFMSTTAYHPGLKLRTYPIPWNSHASMMGILIFDSGFYTIDPCWEIPWLFDFNSFIHILLECTTIPWESSSLLVISLTLAKSIHQWLVIKWFLPCSTPTLFFTWLELY